MASRSNTNTQCDNELLMESDYGYVTRCRHCNLCQLHIGPASFRLDAEVFESVCAMFVRYALNNDRGLARAPAFINRH